MLLFPIDNSHSILLYYIRDKAKEGENKKQINVKDDESIKIPPRMCENQMIPALRFKGVVENNLMRVIGSE